MIIQTNRQPMYDVESPVLRHVIGNTAIAALNDSVKYVVMTHTGRITSRDINAINISSSSGVSFTRGENGSNADLEITRVSDTQTVIKINKAGIGNLVLQPNTERLQLFYNDEGEVVLKWTFLFPDEEGYDLIQTTPVGPKIIASGITKESPQFLGGDIGGCFLYKVPGGLGALEVGINLKNGGLGLCVKKATGDVTYPASEDLVYWKSGDMISGSETPHIPIVSGQDIETPGGRPQNLEDAGVVVKKTVTAAGETEDISTSKAVFFKAGPLPKYSTYDLKKPYVIRYYSVRCDEPALAAKTWTMQGFNGSTWVDLDVRTEVSGWPATKLCAIANSGPYSKYRFRLDATVSPGPDYLATVHEIKLFGNLEGQGIGSMVIGSTFDIQ